MNVNDLSLALAWAAFWLIVGTLFVTWVVQILLRPQTRMEWAEFGKISAFLLIVLRTAWTLLTGRILPPEVAVVFWVACFLLIANYLVAILDDWGAPFVRGVYVRSANAGYRLWWVIALLTLLVTAAVAYALIFPR